MQNYNFQGGNSQVYGDANQQYQQQQQQSSYNEYPSLMQQFLMQQRGQYQQRDTPSMMISHPSFQSTRGLSFQQLNRISSGNLYQQFQQQQQQQPRAAVPSQANASWGEVAPQPDRYAQQGILAPWSATSASLLGSMVSYGEEDLKRKVTRKKDKDKPKRPLSAYNVFFKEERARLLEACVDEDGNKKLPEGKLGFENLAKQIGHRWQNLTAEEAAPYKEKAAEDMKRYKQQMAEYNEKKRAKEEGTIVSAGSLSTLDQSSISQKEAPPAKKQKTSED